MAELAVVSGETLRQRLRTLEKRLGASASGRTAVPATDAARAALAGLAASPPDRVGRCRVRGAMVCDGVRLALDDGFLMLRASGTEPLLRVYADGPTQDALQSRLQEGIRLLRRRIRG
jgi:phosphomannomutase